MEQRMYKKKLLFFCEENRFFESSKYICVIFVVEKRSVGPLCILRIQIFSNFFQIFNTLLEGGRLWFLPVKLVCYAEETTNGILWNICVFALLTIT